MQAFRCHYHYCCCRCYCRYYCYCCRCCYIVVEPLGSLNEHPGPTESTIPGCLQSPVPVFGLSRSGSADIYNVSHIVVCLTAAWIRLFGYRRLNDANSNMKFGSFMRSFVLGTYIAPLQDATTQRRSQPAVTANEEGSRYTTGVI